MRRIRRKDRNSITRLQSINRSLIGLRIAYISLRESSERRVEAVVHFRNVLLEMITDGWEFAAGGADHGEVADFASAA